MSRLRWTNNQQRYGITIGRRYHKNITKKTVEDLHTLTKVLLNTTVDFKLVVSTNQGYVYSNDLSLIDLLDHMPELSFKEYSQAVITRPTNSIQLKKSVYSYRSYLRLIKLTAQQKQQLILFFHNQRTQIRVSPALTAWITQSFNRTQDYFFIDHHSESWCTMISLVHPGIIRKTMHIISAK
jgi:hypothetical protein